MAAIGINQTNDRSPIGINPKPYTPKPPKPPKSPKVTWVVFFMIITAFQLGTPLIANYDFESFYAGLGIQIGDPLESFFDIFPSEIKENFWVVSIPTLIPVWVFGIKHRKNKTTVILMRVVIGVMIVLFIMVFFIAIAMIVMIAIILMVMLFLVLGYIWLKEKLGFSGGSSGSRERSNSNYGDSVGPISSAFNEERAKPVKGIYD